MKSIAQLFRQPIKALSGILLVSLAVAVLCVCVGQATAAANMRQSVEESYHTVALPANKYQNGQYPQDVLDWIDQAVERYPDIILSDSYAGLADAYIQDLDPINYTRYLLSSSDNSSSETSNLFYPQGAPYHCAMLEITLDSVSVKNVTESGIVTAALRGTVERVLGLQQGYNDPTGYKAEFTFQFQDTDMTQSQFIEGERYLIYCMDYYDLDWSLRSALAAPRDNVGGLPGTYDGMSYDRFDSANLRFLHPDFDSEEEWQTLIDSGRALQIVAYYRLDYVKEDGTAGNTITTLTAWEMLHAYQNVTGTLLDYSAVSGDDKDRTPTFAHLTGTAEEFLASEDGSLWRETLSNLVVTNHAFPVVGVDELMYVGDFARQYASVTEGRNFTSDELANGANACIISRTLAMNNGLTIGDTISVQYYTAAMDEPMQTYINHNEGIVNTGAHYFTSSSTLAEAEQVYTIVGLYDQNIPWDLSGENLYAFTPNTIFVPKNSVASDLETSYLGMYRSLVLPNGGMDEFQTLLSMSGMDGLFLTYDQGYTDVINHLYGYELIADQALKIGLVVYAIVILLYFVLFPAQQGKTISQMATMGATRFEKLRHINISSFAILIPGSLFGITAGIALRKTVMDALANSASVAQPLEMDVNSLIAIGFIQLLITIVITFLISLPLTRSRSLLKRRGILEQFRLLRKTPLHTWAVTVLALIISVVLCTLHASNEAELKNFEKTRMDVPITVSVTNLRGDQTTGLNLDGWVVNILAGDFSFSLTDYLEDIRIEFHIDPQNVNMNINGRPADRMLQGIMSASCAPELLPVTDSHITWNDGYDEHIFAGSELVCIVPEGYKSDADPSTDAQELNLYFARTEYKRDSMGVVIDSRFYEYEYTLTVVGTYHSSMGADAIYCPFRAADLVTVKLGMTPELDSAGAVLKNNSEMDAFWTAAERFFVEPGIDAQADGSRKYALRIDTSALEKAEAVLNNSIMINRISTLLVFLLSAGAGFFVGFLMIRSRKREIILMRTLGKSNPGIYRNFSLEQMGYVLLGTVIGGAAFLWQPLGRLALFLLIYYVGLTTALLIFLNSRLITNMKEDE